MSVSPIKPFWHSTGLALVSRNLILPTQLRRPDGPHRGREGRRGHARFRTLPPRRADPCDLGSSPRLRGGARGARRFDSPVPTKSRPRTIGQDARPREGGESRHRRRLQTRVLEEPRGRVGRGEASAAVPEGPRDARPGPKEPRQLPRDDPRRPEPDAQPARGRRRLHDRPRARRGLDRSEEHTSELQSHSNISYAVFCLKKKKKKEHKKKSNAIIKNNKTVQK